MRLTESTLAMSASSKRLAKVRSKLLLPLPSWNSPPPKALDVFDLQAWGRFSATNMKSDRNPRLDRKRDLLLAFATVSLPLLVIAVILVSFVFNVSARQRPDLFVGTSELPVTLYDTANAFYTGISPGSFLLLGSWASNIAEIVIAPFMVIFSYAVAREVLRGTVEGNALSDQRPPFLSEIVKGSHGMSTSESTALPHD